MLWVVMPVYNEEASVAKVLDEWVPVLRKTVGTFRFLALNDGSKDSTQKVLEENTNRFPELEVIQKRNSGHGKTCLLGYEMALKGGATWVLQIDSDGQCDASFFQDFWNSTRSHLAIFGVRRQRDDGLARWLISKFVTLAVLLSTFRFVRDPNVPYRLIRSDILAQATARVPNDFYLTNILISARVKPITPIKWVPIIFRDRFGGSPSIRTFSFAKEGIRLFLLLCRETLFNVRTRTKVVR